MERNEGELAVGSTSHAPARSGHCLVATASRHATEAALEILRAGGNAVDAAVGAAFALAVCEPTGSGLGGQATALVARGDGEVLVVDGHSRAPAAASLDRIDRLQQHCGHRATTIPSMPAVMGLLHERFGRLAWPSLLEPAIRLAEEGYPMGRLQRRQTRWCTRDLGATPATARLFLKGGEPYGIGETFRQPALATTLRRLARAGVADFYRGALARAIAEDMRRHGGLLTAEDLAGYGTPPIHRSLWIEMGGSRIHTAPPPAGGAQLLLALRLMGRVRPPDHLDEEAGRYARLAEVIPAALRERERWATAPGPPVGDAGPYLDEGRVAHLAAEIEVALSGAAEVRPRAVGSCEVGGDEDERGGETTHLCTADAGGHLASLTLSVQSLFGAKVANAECGFLYNNYLTTCPRHPHPHRLAGGGLPRSNAAPTIVLPVREDGGGTSAAPGPFLALGAAGSRRITSALVQVLDGVLSRGLRLDAAVAAPRIHALLSRKVWLERPAASGPLLAHLAGRSRAVRLRPALSYSMGAVQAVRLGVGGATEGAADPRREGTAAGFTTAEDVP